MIPNNLQHISNFRIRINLSQKTNLTQGRLTQIHQVDFLPQTQLQVLFLPQIHQGFHLLDSLLINHPPVKTPHLAFLPTNLAIKISNLTETVLDFLPFNPPLEISTLTETLLDFHPFNRLLGMSTILEIMKMKMMFLRKGRNVLA